jgi:DNA-binding NarL/FixJ family response regulator
MTPPPIQPDPSPVVISRRWTPACVGVAAPLAILTTHEYRLLTLVAHGWSNDRIGRHVGLPRTAVADVLRRAREGVGLHSERELVSWYFYTLALGIAQRTETPTAVSRGALPTPGIRRPRRGEGR